MKNFNKWQQIAVILVVVFIAITLGALVLHMFNNPEVVANAKFGGL